MRLFSKDKVIAQQKRRLEKALRAEGFSRSQAVTAASVAYQVLLEDKG